MRIEDSWQYLDWEYVCDQAPGIFQQYEKDTHGDECPDGWYQYINTAEGLHRLAQEWWDSLTKERRIALLQAALRTHLDLAAGARRALRLE